MPRNWPSACPREALSVGFDDVWLVLQARATLEYMLTEQIAERKTSISDLKEKAKAVQRLLEAAAQELA